MIRFPRLGMEVRLHYRRSAADSMPYEGNEGVVVAMANGRGPRNVLVLLRCNRLVVVPKGNLGEI